MCIAQAGMAQAGMALNGAGRPWRRQAWRRQAWRRQARRGQRRGGPRLSGAPGRRRGLTRVPDEVDERTVPGTHPKVENLFIFSAGTFRQKLAAIVRLEVQKDEAAV